MALGSEAGLSLNGHVHLGELFRLYALVSPVSPSFGHNNKIRLSVELGIKRDSDMKQLAKRLC